MTGDFQRYLRAKRTVDDRALDRRLVDVLREMLTRRAATQDSPLRVLEVGAGIGTMVTRLLDWDILPEGEVQYRAIDLEAANISELDTSLRQWADDRSVSVSGTDPLVLEHANGRLVVESVVEEAATYADSHGGWDLLVGAALLDVFDLTNLGTLLGALAPAGVFYFPITFDGGTRFRPARPADRAIERDYHEHMDAKAGGNSRAGETVLARLTAADGVGRLDSAGSDWIVRPVGDSYPADEAFFLRYILDTIERAVGELRGDSADSLENWLATRRSQVAAGELVYLTHQLDILGRADDPRLVAESVD